MLRRSSGARAASAGLGTSALARIGLWIWAIQIPVALLYRATRGTPREISAQALGLAAGAFVQAGGVCALASSGSRLNLGLFLKGGFDNVFRILVVTLATSLVVLVGAALFILPGIIALVRLGPVIVVSVTRQVGAAEALTETWKLTKRNWMHSGVGILACTSIALFTVLVNHRLQLWSDGIWLPALAASAGSALAYLALLCILTGHYGRRIQR